MNEGPSSDTPSLSPEEIHSFGDDTTIALGALAAFLKAEDYDDLWSVLIDYAKAIGADLLSYHHYAPEFSPNQENVSVRTYGFPKAWIENYVDQRLYRIDPITQVFKLRTRPMKWSRVVNAVPLSPAQIDYVDSLKSWMTGDGMGLPVFGPSGRYGYISIGRKTEPIDSWGVLQSHRMHWVMESFHMRWCELILTKRPLNFTLDSKELRILEAIAIGMQDEVICGLVGAQLDSVQQSIRTMMRKMNVTDRPSAILCGVGAGLLGHDSLVIDAV